MRYHLRKRGQGAEAKAPDHGKWISDFGKVISGLIAESIRLVNPVSLSLQYVFGSRRGQ